MFSVDATIGRFNSNHGSLSAFVGTAYGSAKSFAVVKGQKKAENMLDDSIVPAYGAEFQMATRQNQKLSFSGGISWLYAMPTDWSGRNRNGVVPRNNLILNGNARYRLPWKLLRAKTSIALNGVYADNLEFLAEKSSATLMFILVW